VQKALERFASGLRGRFGERLTDLRLFGSQARGETWRESDVDVLVLIADVTRTEADEVAGMAADAGLLDDACVVLSPFVRSPEAFEELRRRELRIARDIDREGIPL
jgi:predicted nucleotidyltransferase